MNCLAQNLLYLRKKKKIQQAQIPATLGFPQSTWSYWENGKTPPDIGSLITISDYFEVSIDDIVRVNLEEADVHLNEKPKVGKKVHPKVHGNVHPKPEKEGILNLSAEDQEVLTMPYPELCKMVRQMRKELNKIKL